MLFSMYLYYHGLIYNNANGMRNLQYEMRICQKSHNKVTKTVYVRFEFLWIRRYLHCCVAHVTLKGFSPSLHGFGLPWAWSLCEHEFYVGVAPCGRGLFLSWPPSGRGRSIMTKKHVFLCRKKKPRK